MKIKDAINPVLNEKNLFPVKKIATAANALNRTERNRAKMNDKNMEWGMNVSFR